MSRTPIMAGNWKMNLDHVAATSLVQDLGEALKACLLYTSPSPRDATLSRMPSSA